MRRQTTTTLQHTSSIGPNFDWTNRKPSPKPIVDVFRSSTPIVKVFRNGLQRVSYKELYDATSGFSSETLIGMGGYGSVYKGVLRENESSIAVKVLNLVERGALKSFMVECKILKEIRHRNLLKMLTVCSSIDFNGNDFRALIFELMPNGSVESWLHPSSNRQQPYRNLDFLQRLNIATDIASALDYLHNHQKTPIIHCDLKPSNVLLNKDMVACVADFGLAKFSRINTINQSRTETNSVAVRGTIGYIPPECSMGAKVHTKWDAYSYGILILELFTGKRPTDAMFVNRLNIRSFCKDNLSERAMSILDSRLGIGEFIDENEPRRLTVKMKKCLISILKIGLACSSELIVERMEIGEALIKMQNIRKRVLLQGTAHNKM